MYSAKEAIEDLDRIFREVLARHGVEGLLRSAALTTYHHVVSASRGFTRSGPIYVIEPLIEGAADEVVGQVSRENQGICE